MFKNTIASCCLFIMAIAHDNAIAQECGPFCPVCSGSGSSTGALVSSGTVISNLLYIPAGEEETGVINFRGGITSWLDLGIGYTVKAEKPIWSIRWQPLNEAESGLRPAVITGTGSIQTGGGDQSIFLQLSKAWEFSEMFSARLSTGIASLLPDLNKLYGLAGITLTVKESWSPFVSYDGVNFHSGLSWIATDWLTIAAILVETKEPAISIGLRYSVLANK